VHSSRCPDLRLPGSSQFSLAQGGRLCTAAKLCYRVAECRCLACYNKYMFFGCHSRRGAGHAQQQGDQTCLLEILFFWLSPGAGEQVMHSSKVYTKLSERLGLHDHHTGDSLLD
jgi:hypothetical protein